MNDPDQPVPCQEAMAQAYAGYSTLQVAVQLYSKFKISNVLFHLYTK